MLTYGLKYIRLAIEKRAYELWEQYGGSDFDNWIQAELEVMSWFRN